MIRKQAAGEETFYYHDDHLGSPILMTDKNGNVVWNVAMDPFGNAIPYKGRHGAYVRNVTNNLRFPGQYYDAESGLHQNWHRDYDPELGRYVEADPIGLMGGTNMYSYVLGNPIALSDPDGRRVWNRGNTPVLIKPEQDGIQPIVLMPGDRDNGAQDGVYPYFWSASRVVFKNTDGLDVTVMPDGEYLVSGGTPDQYLAQALYGGWKDQAFLAANQDWPSRQEADRLMRAGWCP